MLTKETKKLAELVKDIRVAMLTTVDKEGEFRSRPMATSEIKEEGVIYFFTQAHTPKTEELDKNHKVNICFVDRDDQVYVSVSGQATVIRDQAKINELWTPFLKAWFPKGKEDQNINLLRVEISKAEYWDSPGNRMVQLLGMTKAAITGKPYDAGENEKINF